ncbi:hypothetical protein FOPG_18517 [Fusarium oxysporum f. sp. conglutinans race 2 54008]|uniref:Uncharacterized protein n=1 Tax=Fusarium oxysporum f. sp. conglutinans race 2 54008 TaxID=1089457 RepID=X0GZI6_FUSOX|nr:hypothetical protein FOPG_18517 [Fusarium oxysporum f. sp. conglutinans race 2 54008]
MIHSHFFGGSYIYKAQHRHFSRSLYIRTVIQRQSRNEQSYTPSSYGIDARAMSTKTGKRAPERPWSAA